MLPYTFNPSFNLWDSTVDDLLNQYIREVVLYIDGVIVNEFKIPLNEPIRSNFYRYIRGKINSSLNTNDIKKLRWIVSSTI